MCYEGMIITNKIGGLTIQQIMDLPREQTIAHMRKFVHKQWGRPDSSESTQAIKRYRVRVSYLMWEEDDISIDAIDEDDLRNQIQVEYDSYEDHEFDIIEEIPCVED